MQPNGFSMKINENPINSAMCVICTDLVGPGTPRISTYIGTSQQSDVCRDCAKMVAELAPKSVAPKGTGKTRVEAVV